MKEGFRQCMAWLHTWSGLLLGWLLFAIFLTGTVAYFRSEVTHWMQPELHGSTPGPRSLELALERLERVAPDAAVWTVALPDERSRTVQIAWREEGAPVTGRRGGPREVLDAGTGQPLQPRETAGGEFLYRFHFELYALPREWARWIVGIATMAMFVAIISGIVTHKKIFADFFTFRPGKGQRSWLDAHAATAVLALPYHLMITYSGLVLFIATLLPWTAQERGRPPGGAGERPAAVRAAPERLAAAVPVAVLMAQAEERWGRPAGRITIEKPGRAGMTVEFAPARNGRLTANSGSGAGGVERLRYDGADGRLLRETAAPDLSAVQATANALGSLHRARFADTGLRWLFFLSGVAGTVMVGSGMVLWTVKRARTLPLSFGRRLVLVLNVGGIAGMTAAVGAYFWANRLLPAGLPDRPEWEIGAFFLIWLLFLLHPLLRPVRTAWVEQLAAGAVLFAGLPVLNVLTAGGLPVALARGDWMLAGFDLTALATGLALGYAARRVARHGATAAPAAPGRATAMKRAIAGGAAE